MAEPDSAHRRPAGVTGGSVAAVGGLREALESTGRAR
jgi:hypothetical protein